MRYLAAYIKVVAGFCLVAVLAYMMATKRVYKQPENQDGMKPLVAAGKRKIFDVKGGNLAVVDRGDIVAYRYDATPNKSDSLIGRVVAVAGDRLSFADGKMTLNSVGKTRKGLNKLQRIEFQVPRGCVYVLLENRKIESDSGAFGPIETWRIHGKIRNPD